MIDVREYNRCNKSEENFDIVFCLIHVSPIVRLYLAKSNAREITAFSVSAKINPRENWN